MDERMKQRWLELSSEAMDELVKWREANPLATFAQIEQQLDDRLADARARMLGDLAEGGCQKNCVSDLLMLTVFRAGLCLRR